jgi:hypothetical protein
MSTESNVFAPKKIGNDQSNLPKRLGLANRNRASGLGRERSVFSSHVAGRVLVFCQI